jgi:hypothetical protein
LLSSWFRVKNIARPVRVYTLRAEAVGDPPALSAPLSGVDLLDFLRGAYPCTGAAQ